MKAKFNVGDKARIINNGKMFCTYNDFFSENKICKKISQKYAYGVDFINGEIVTILAVGKHGLNLYFNPYYYVIERNDGKVSIINEIGLELVESVADEITINRYGNKVVAKMGKKTGVARCNETDTFDLYTGVKIAVDRLFGKESEVKEVNEVKRKAEVGEYIKIIHPYIANNFYKNGDILKVKSLYANSIGGVHVDIPCCPFIDLDEYVVLENYKPHKKPQEEKPKYYNGKVVCVKSKDLFLTVGKIYVFKDGLSKWNSGEQLPQSRLREPIKSLTDLNEWNSNTFIELVEDK